MKIVIKHLLPTIILLLPFLVTAAEYQPLVILPGNINPNDNFDGYINALYIISISIAGLLAVIKIIIGGIKWMTTDIVPSKREAKKDIYGAVLGLLVVLAAVLVLNVINPNITDVDIRLNKIGADNSSNQITIPVNRGATYDYISTSDTADPANFQRFSDECASTNGKLRNEGEQTRCYKLQGTEAFVKNEAFCKNMDEQVCNTRPENKETARQQCEDVDGGRFVVDREDSRRGICFSS